MNRLVISLFLSLILIYGSESYVEFCDLKSFTNVFNVGHFIHMTRCNQTWTWDPRMRDGKGDFIRDYSWYTYARNKTLEWEDIKQLPENFRFAAFSFHEISCDKIPEKGDNSCPDAVHKWNDWGVIIIKPHSDSIAFSFKYDYDFHTINASENPLLFNHFELRENDPKSTNHLFHPFWPDIEKLTKDWKTEFKNKGLTYHSALYSPHNHLLFMVLKMKEEALDVFPKTSSKYCLTYIDLTKPLFDAELITEKLVKSENFYDWNKPRCFSGHVIGMFHNETEKRAYLVGRIDTINPRFEDQVYQIEVQTGEMARLTSMVQQNNGGVRQYGEPRNLRQYFGCVTENSTSNSRKKRAIKERQRLNRFSWKAIQQELRDDWLQLSIMSNSVLFILYLIFRLSKN